MYDCEIQEYPTFVTEPAMQIVLINPYEIGRQPFGVAQPAALLREQGCEVRCLDLSIEKLNSSVLKSADAVGIYVAMHTATRIAVEVLPRIRELVPRAHLFVYGLYAPMNEALLRSLGAATVLGGEFEPGIVSMIDRLRSGGGANQIEPVVSLSKVAFRVPDRSGLPDLSQYAHLVLPDGNTKTVGFVEASRGCKHFCRHCPVVPVYEGKFRIVPRAVVAADIRNQVRAGAEHISFGDPDFLNGPTHALKVVRTLHEEFPQVSYDATIKIEHILEHRDLIPVLRDTGCLFITTAVESFDDGILERFDKNHTAEDFEAVVSLMRDVGIGLAPTFVAFTPWTTLEGYIHFLRRIHELGLVESIPPIQLAIRLLVPEGSFLLQLEGFRDLIEQFDSTILGYPWRHEDERVDRLQATIQAEVSTGEERRLSRSAIFSLVWTRAHAALDRPAPPLPFVEGGEPVPYLSEAWYCCAEPTTAQLNAF